MKDLIWWGGMTAAPGIAGVLDVISIGWALGLCVMTFCGNLYLRLRMLQQAERRDALEHEERMAAIICATDAAHLDVAASVLVALRAQPPSSVDPL